MRYAGALLAKTLLLATGPFEPVQQLEVDLWLKPG